MADEGINDIALVRLLIAANTASAQPKPDSTCQTFWGTLELLSI